MMRSSLTGKVTLAALIILVMIIGAAAGTLRVIAGISDSIEHLTDHTIKRITHTDAASSFLSRALAEAYAAAASGSRAKIAVARVYVAAARNELMLLPEHETHDVAAAISADQEMLQQRYIHLADDVEAVLLSLETAITENKEEAIASHSVTLIALIGQSGQLAEAMSALGLREFRETEEELRVQIDVANRALAGASVVLILAAVMTLFLLRRHIVKPLELLAATAQAMSERRDVSPLRITSHDEIGRLQRAFNEMTAALA
ncbi:MAG: HAMP domain-containing protein [Roseiflexaceae bacterium]|nr:HAMP domain-containing protein [Roseiflexus sp.]MDW8214521.1 HAMP domain-containing protein [Roseiflexaceae bacterium]